MLLISVAIFFVSYKIMKNDKSIIYWTYDGLNGKYYPYLKFNGNINEAWPIDGSRWIKYDDRYVGQVMLTVTDSVFEFGLSFDSSFIYTMNKLYFMKGIGFINEEQEGGNTLSLLGCIVKRCKIRYNSRC